ncbi:hypothetical protein FB567DRAFT_611728 [Paraphoma chrysanthemicola]|uniref:Uncharacterized protein n=1 Tax=Paraphoma chrysanthemicola TaxID=798071 RepID=A0A8K0QUH7_9PLEO|nr:hypothetical protein FB567DRAFT_611728 [Paraphoma chrysanthemicola]
MIETFKDMKHGKSSSYENLALERTANQILHHMEDKDSEDSLETNARAIYGANRLLDVISFAPTSSRKIGAAIVEHNPTSRSYVHCTSAKEDSRLAAVEHLLVITEDILQRMLDAEGIISIGWLPATAQAQHAATYSVNGGSATGSVQDSRRSSVAPQEAGPVGFINDHYSPHSQHHIQNPQSMRGNSETSFNFQQITPQPHVQSMQRTASDVIKQPQPVPVGHAATRGLASGRVAWRLGSED